MLRTIFVILIIVVGLIYSVQGPFYALLFYLWYAYFRPETWIWSDFLTYLNLSLIVGGFLVLASLPKLGGFRLTSRVLLVILFLVQSIISLLAAEHLEWSLPLWVDFLKVIVITLLMTFLISDQKRYRLTLLVIALSLGFETAKQGWAQLVLNPGATNNNQHAMLGDNNGVAVGVLMLVPVFVALAQTTTSRLERSTYYVFIAGLVYRAISTYSRGAFLAGGVLAAIMLWRSPRKIRALVATSLLCGVIYSVMPSDYWDRMNTITASDEERDYSSQGRIHFWHVGTLMAAAKPLTGVGFNGYSRSFETYNDQEGWDPGRAAHSAWFGTLGDMGYPGLLLLILVIATALFSCSRIKKRARPANQIAIGRFAANMQATLLVYVAGATFLSAQYLEMFWHMIGLTIALERIQAEENQSVKTTAGQPVPVQAAVSLAR